MQISSVHSPNAYYIQKGAQKKCACGNFPSQNFIWNLLKKRWRVGINNHVKKMPWKCFYSGFIFKCFHDGGPAPRPPLFAQIFLLRMLAPPPVKTSYTPAFVHKQSTFGAPCTFAYTKDRHMESINFVLDRKITILPRICMSQVIHLLMFCILKNEWLDCSEFAC